MSNLRPRHTASVGLAELAHLLGVDGPGTGPQVSGVTLDSRAVLPGDLYAALPGANVHGGRFAGGARPRVRWPS